MLLSNQKHFLIFDSKYGDDDDEEEEGLAEGDQNDKTLLGGGESEEYDLNSLALKFNMSNNKNESSLISGDTGLLSTSVSKLYDPSAVGLNLGSSIDNLLNSYFTESISSGHAAVTASGDNSNILLLSPKLKHNNNDDIIIEEEKEEEDDLSKLIYHRTKSISISGGFNHNNSDPKSENMDLATGGAFSLSDLANEYLSNTNTNVTNSNYSSDTNMNTTAVNFIDYELMKQLTLDRNESSSNNFDVDLDKHNILIINKSTNSKDKHFLLNNKLSTSYELSSSINSNLSSSLNTISLNNSHNSGSGGKNNLQLIPPQFDLMSNESIFVVENSSILGALLSNSFVFNNENIELSSIIEKKFNFAYQMKLIAKHRKLLAKSRKRLRVVLNEPFRISTNNLPKTAAGAKKSIPNKKKKSILNPSSSSSSVKYQINKNKDSPNTVIKIFDFAIPSPDDVVLAKQKFAFKNIRFK